MHRIRVKARSIFEVDSNVLYISMTASLIILSFHTWYRLLPLVFRNLGANDLQVSTSFAIISGGFTLLQYPGGILADKFGRKPLIVFPTYGAAFFYFLASLTSHWVTLAIMALAANLCMALQSPSFIALIAESSTLRERAKSYGVFNFFIAVALSLGPALGAILLGFVEIKVLMQISSGAFLVAGILRQKFLREPASKNKLDASPQTMKIAKLFRGTMLRLLLINILFMVTLNLTLWGPFIPLYAEDVLGYTRGQINLLFAFGNIAGAIVSLLGGKVNQLLGEKKALAGGLLVHSLFLVAYLWKGSFIFSIGILIFGYMFFQISIIAFDTLRVAYIEEGKRATILGLLSTISGVIAAASISLAGYLKTAFGEGLPFLMAPVIATLACLLVYKLKDADQDKEHTESA